MRPFDLQPQKMHNPAERNHDSEDRYPSLVAVTVPTTRTRIATVSPSSTSSLPVNLNGYNDVTRVALVPSTKQQNRSSSIYSTYSLEFSQSGDHGGPDRRDFDAAEARRDPLASNYDRNDNATHSFPPPTPGTLAPPAQFLSRFSSSYNTHDSNAKINRSVDSESPKDGNKNGGTPRKPPSPPSTLSSKRRPGSIGTQMKWFWLGSWLNVLLLCIPVAWGLHFGTSGYYIPVFIFSFFGIIPLARLLSEATDEMSNHVGQTIAGIMNATFGNVVELIVAIIAIIKCELQITQSSLAGSIMSNLLLVLGMSFFVGGVRYSQQEFVMAAAQTYSTLLILSVTAVLLPAGFHFAVKPDASNSNSQVNSKVEAHDLLSLSHGAAIILIITYCIFLYFQMWTHEALFDPTKEKCESTKYSSANRKPFNVKKKKKKKKKTEPQKKERK